MDPDDGGVAGVILGFVLGIVGVVGLVVVGAVVVLTVGLSGLGGKGRADVKPIPVPKTACPYLRAVHTTGHDAGEGWFDVMGTSDPAWQRFAVQLAPRLANFELALRVAIPHSPAPVARDLRETLRQVQIGRARLDGSRSFTDYVDKTDWAVFNGVQSMSHATALVGNACGFRLLTY